MKFSNEINRWVDPSTIRVGTVLLEGNDADGVLGGVARFCLEALIEDPLALTGVATPPLVVDGERPPPPLDESVPFDDDSEEEEDKQLGGASST